MERKFEYLWNRQVVYRRDPITDIPNEKTEQYMFFKDGTYRSFYWHMMVLWYLNPEWEEDYAMEIAMYLADKSNGFITFYMNRWNVARVIYDLSVVDRDEPPRNKIRKIIFKMGCGLTKSEKLSIVGKLIGRLNGVKKEDIYGVMLLLNDGDQKITIAKLAKNLKKELNEEIDI